MNHLIAKTNIALNILRPNNKVLMYDDGISAYLLYNQPVQTGGGISPLRYPSWRSFEMIPQKDYQYNVDKFYQVVRDLPKIPVPTLFTGWDQSGGSFLFALKSSDTREKLITGTEALNRHHEAAGLKHDQAFLRRLQINDPEKIKFTHENDLTRLIKTAKNFTNESSVALEMMSSPPKGQLGGGSNSPYSWSDNSSINLSASEWNHCDRNGLALIQDGGNNRIVTLSETETEYLPLSHDKKIPEKYEQIMAQIDPKIAMKKIMNTYLSVPTFKTLNSDTSEAI